MSKAKKQNNDETAFGDTTPLDDFNDFTEGPSQFSIDDLDLTDVDTKVHLLANGIYNFLIKAVKPVPDTEPGHIALLVTLSLAEEGEDTEGGVIREGFTLFDRINLYSKPICKADPNKNTANEMSLKRLAKLVEVVTGEKATKFDPEALVGQYVGATIAVRPAKGQYDASNVIKSYNSKV